MQRLIPGRTALLTLLATLTLAPLAAGQTSLGKARRIAPQPLLPRLAEAPPAHPPAAPCTGCSEGCGSGPRGIPDVYLHSGEFFLEETDLVIPGRGLDFAWTRTYRSRLGPDSAQGTGWDFAYNASIRKVKDGIRLRDGRGRNDLYRLQPDGSYTAAEFFREGRFEPDGSFTLVFADLGEWRFFPCDGSPLAGKLSEIADRNGNTLAFDYDGLGRLEVIVDTLGRRILVAYDANGRIANVTDFLGRQLVYQYYGPGDPNGNPGDLRSARSPLVVGTPNGNDFPSGKLTRYTYSKGFADERLNHNLLEVVDPKGQTWLVNEYAAETDPEELLFDRLVRQTRGAPGDVIDLSYELMPESGPAALLAIVNDRVGNVSEYAYDLLGRCVALRRLTGRADPDQPTTRTQNRPTGQLRPGDPSFFESRWTYNADSKVTEVVHPNGNLTQNVYELELDPLASPRSRGNLRERRRLSGTHVPVGDQTVLVETFEYDAALGGCCGSNFVTRHVDARGNVTEHDYDPSGNRIQTRHPIPSVVEDFTYNAWGQPTTHLHPDDGKGSRQLDRWLYYGPAAGAQNGYLMSEIQDLGGFALTTTWVYDAAGNAVQVTDARGNTTTMIVNELNQVVRRISPPVQTGGSPAQYEVDTWFDANDNVVRVDTKNFDDMGNLAPNPYLTLSYQHGILNEVTSRTEEVDPTRDVVTEYEYDANRNRTLVRFGEATRGAQPTNLEQYLYDERDLLFRQVRAAGDPLQSSTQHDYDGNGNRIRVTSGLEDAAPRVRTFVYDAYERLVLETDAMGNERSFSFDENGNVVHEQLDGELCDVPGGAANVRLFEASHAHDAMDRRVSTIVEHFDPETQMPVGDGQSQTSWTWTDRSMVATVTDDNGNVTSYCYDTLGRESIVTDAAGNTVRRVYDANHNVVQVVETEKSDLGNPDETFVSTWSFDAIDRCTVQTDPLGNDVVTGYDSRDNPTRIVDALGNVTLQTFDGLDRLLLSTRNVTDDGTGGGVIVGRIDRTLSWDDSSRMSARIDDAGNTTSYVYDPLGRLRSTLFADGTSETAQHDAHGNVVLRVDANGTQVTSTYDLANRPATRAIVPGAGVSSDTTFEVWKHDGLSRAVHAEDDDSLVTALWDSLSRRIRESQDGLALTAVHDGNGNELLTSYPGGTTVSYGHDALNRIDAVTSTGPTASYDYVGPWRVEARTTGAGVATSTYTYDGTRRTTAVLHTAGATPLVRRTYAWDPMYNRTRDTDLRTGVVQDFAYDSQYRLVQSTETVPGTGASTIQYTFDGVGNRTSVVGGPCAGVYVMDGTLPGPADLQMNQYSRTPCTSLLEYDANGNQTSRGGGAETLAYDYRDRLVLHQGPGGTTTFAYDALGRNVEKAGPLGTVRYVYDGNDVVEQRDGTGALVAGFVLGRSVGFDDPVAWAGFNPQPEPPPQREILEILSGGLTFYLFADDLGSTMAVTDVLGNLVEQYEYGDSGQPSFFDGAGVPLASSAIGNEWLFTGQRWDVETGFYCYDARFMDPDLGQFLSRDPLGMWGDPVNLGNGRTYVGNNFRTLVDPTGMVSKACAGPWPGPKTVYYGLNGCGSTLEIPAALCGAMRGAGKGKRAARLWNTWELTGYPGGWEWFRVLPFYEWFAGPDAVINPLWRLVILDTMTDVWEPFRAGKEIGIECEFSCGSSKNAYVAWYDSNVHLCENWWDFSSRRQSGILLHELSHRLGGTDDHFYYKNATDPTGVPVGNVTVPNYYETNHLATNADTYEGIYLKYYLR